MIEASRKREQGADISERLEARQHVERLLEDWMSETG